MVDAESVAPDVVVEVAYRLFDESGALADEVTADEPLSFLYGYAQVVPALEDGLSGARVGEPRRIDAAPVEAFGERDDGAMLEIDRHDFPGADAVGPGDEVVVTGPDGLEVAHRVVDVTADAVIVDLNHPLAGQRVRFEVTVCSLRAASDDELDAAQAVVDELLVDAGAIVYASQPGAEHTRDDPRTTEGANERLVQLRNPCRESDEEKP
jgi:FKBP-type peptidyl-prolyl cis-trans isomerase SlyD